VAAVTVAAGAVLGIRGAVTSAATPGPRVAQHVYVVRAGDTLWSVAARVAGPRADPRPVVDDLIRRNGIVDARIRPGQRLLMGS